VPEANWHQNRRVLGRPPDDPHSARRVARRGPGGESRRFIDRLGGPVGLAVCYEAGPGGFALWGLLSSMRVGCDVIAPSLVPVRAGGGKTDRRDAKKLVRLFRAGELTYVQAPTSETEGLRDLLRCPKSRRRFGAPGRCQQDPTITAATITTTHAPPAGTFRGPLRLQRPIPKLTG